MVTFNYVAAHYLWAWFCFDQPIVHSFRQAIAPTDFNKFLSDYKVARTISGEGPERLTYFISCLEETRNLELTRENTASVVEALTKRIAEHYGGKSPGSAVSKAMWMIHRHPVAIMDSLARKSIEHYHRRVSNYSSYYEAWLKEFDARIDDIIRSQEWLITSDFAGRLILHQVTSSDALTEIVQSDWFANRILDQWLVITASPHSPADVARLMKPCDLH